MSNRLTEDRIIQQLVGWAEGQERPLVVLVMVEGGGASEQGSETTAGPAARHILESYYGVEGEEEPTDGESAPAAGPTTNPEDGPTPIAPQSTVPAAPAGTGYYGDPGYSGY